MALRVVIIIFLGFVTLLYKAYASGTQRGLDISSKNLNVDRHKRDASLERKPDDKLNVEVHHHHHYYYHCPDPGRAPPQVVGGCDCPEPRVGGCAPDCQCTQGGKCTCRDPAGSVSCHCDMRGSCSCKVAEEVLQGTPGVKGTDPRGRGDYSFSTLFDDPVGKEFFNFITKRFLSKPKDREKTERETTKLQDPVCKEFFKVLSKILKRKSVPHTREKTDLFKDFLTLYKNKKERDKERRRVSNFKDLVHALQQEMREDLSDLSDRSDSSFLDSIGKDFLGL